MSARESVPHRGSDSSRTHDSTTQQPPIHSVVLIDSAETIVRVPGDALRMVLALVGIVMTLLLGIYAHATTTGVTKDVSSVVTTTARAIVLIPVNVLEGAVSVFVPLFVVGGALLRRRWRHLAMALAAALVASIAAEAITWALLRVKSDNPFAIALTQHVGGERMVTLSIYVTVLAALLTTAGRGITSRIITTSWYALWLVLVLAIIQGHQTMPAALTSVLLGRLVGLAICFLLGVRSARAWGVDLVAGLRRAGINPYLVVRLDHVDDLCAWQITSAAPLGHVETADVDPTTPAHMWADMPDDLDYRPATLMAALGSGRDQIALDPLTDAQAVRDGLAADLPPRLYASAHRTFAVYTDPDHQKRVDVVVLDAEQHVLGLLETLWDNFRNRGFERRFAPQVKETAERTMLLNHEARAAGVNTPQLLGAAEADGSIILPMQALTGARVLAQLDHGADYHTIFASLWQQVAHAHRRGLAHHDLSDLSVFVDHENVVWLMNWQDGSVAASDLARRIDLAQLLALTACYLGVDDALEVAKACVGTSTLSAAAALLQNAALPSRTRAQVKTHHHLLQQLRDALGEDLPAPAEPVRLQRFSLRSAAVVAIGAIAIYVLLGSLQLDDVLAAVGNANPWWMAASFSVGLVTYLGAAIGLVAFTPEKIGLWRTTLVQVAASIIALVAPAGIGPAAMDLRFLTKANIPAPLAAATVTLTQVSRFVITTALLVIVALGSGSAGSIAWPQLPTVLTIGGVLALIGIAFAFPKVRRWVWAKIGPALTQAWPRTVWLLANPKRLVAAIAGNIIMTVAYVAAFGFALAAFGYQLSPITLAITFLVANSAGSAVPAPGGIGPVELALTSGLALAGIPYATAVSVTVIYRLLTFWGRVPLGWFALRYLERHHAI
ncbi:MAG: lysylphosphatidylglycerol synthase transmembrane domain-containing protein [Bowdeniella nasicola]|nr:lysylphosphatidylglycerol synthase transmembrane domain-containing protein [Bowdeniella nasicola]